jgi:hypothetical protein
MFAYVFAGLLMELRIRVYLMLIKQWNNRSEAYNINKARYNKEHQCRTNNARSDLYLDSR